MSIKGAEKVTPPSLHQLIFSGNEKAALELINKGNTELETLDTNGYAPIHWAAKLGSKKVFKALVKKGCSPYQQDKEGFAACYYIHPKQTKLVAYYEKYFPLELVESVDDDLNQQLETALQNMGLHTYSISPKDHATAQSWLINLFTPTEPVEVKKRTTSSKPNIKKNLSTFVSPAQLTQYAFGIVEEISPLKILDILNEHYSKMQMDAKLACIYFVKELVRQDTASEWGNNSVFIKRYNEFLQNLGETLAMAGIRSQMKKLLSQSSLAIAFDLTKIFAVTTLQLTPQFFQSQHLLKKVDDNEAFQALSLLTNRLSEHVCMDLLLSKNPEESAARYCFYIDVIQHCLAEPNNNYAAAFAIYNGLQFNVIQRLKSITSLIPEDYQICMRRFDELFHPSFTGLRQLMLEHPNCIPVTAFYSKSKASITESDDFSTRIMMYGKLNAQFAKHSQHLRTLPHLTERYRTDICEQLHKTTYNDTHAYWYSYQLEPARVIKLEPSLKIEDLRIGLRHCKDVHSPLVVVSGSKKTYGQAAKKQIAEFARQQNWQEEVIIELLGICNDAIRLCDADMPDTLKSQNKKGRMFLYKRTKPKVNEVDELLLSAMSQLKLESSSSNQSESSPKRARSHTIDSYRDRRKSEAPPKKSKKETESSSSGSFTPLADLKRKSSPKIPDAVTDEPKADSKGLLLK